MKPWFVAAGTVVIATTPIVARLVIMTAPGGNNLAELFARPCSEILILELDMNIAEAFVRSVGVNHVTIPGSQYSATPLDGVPPPNTCMELPTGLTSQPSGILPSSESISGASACPG